MSPLAARLLVVGTLLPATAHASVRAVDPESGLPARWPRPSLEFTLDLDDLPPGVEADAARSAAREAARAWRGERSCRAPTVEMTAAAGQVSSGRDGRNTISFRKTWWCKGGIRKRDNCYDPKQIAITSVYFDERRGENEAHIAEVDIELNAVHHAWSTGERGDSTTTPVDLASVLVHEIGHALGFAHPCRPLRAGTGSVDGRAFSACRGAANSIMGPLEIGRKVQLRRQITKEDVEALCAVYDRSSPEARPDPSLAGTKTPRLALVLPWLMAFVALRRRTRPKSDNDYARLY